MPDGAERKSRMAICSVGHSRVTACTWRVVDRVLACVTSQLSQRGSRAPSSPRHPPKRTAVGRSQRADVSAHETAKRGIPRQCCTYDVTPATGQLVEATAWNGSGERERGKHGATRRVCNEGGALRACRCMMLLPHADRHAKWPSVARRGNSAAVCRGVARTKAQGEPRML